MSVIICTGVDRVLEVELPGQKPGLFINFWNTCRVATTPQEGGLGHVTLLALCSLWKSFSPHTHTALSEALTWKFLQKKPVGFGCAVALICVSCANVIGHVSWVKRNSECGCSQAVCLVEWTAESHCPLGVVGKWAARPYRPTSPFTVISWPCMAPLPRFLLTREISLWVQKYRNSIHCGKGHE